jgi:hypothetical protein
MVRKGESCMEGIVIDGKLVGVRTVWDKQAEVVKVIMTFEAEYKRDLMLLLPRTGARLSLTIEDEQGVLPGFDRESHGLLDRDDARVR